MRSTLSSSNAAPGVLTTQHTAFHATSSPAICSIFGIDNEGDNWGIRRDPTDRIRRSSNIVHAAAEIGPAKRSEFDQVGSGFVKYGARISHILYTYHQFSSPSNIQIQSTDL